MNRNQYDTDVTMFSPQGRLFQVEYAVEAVSQGSASLGVVSKNHAVLAGLKRSPSDLASYQRKVFRLDSHVGMVISGLTADARSLSKYMRTETLNHRFVFGTPLPVGRLIADVADKHQECTQTYVRRPYGVGLLVAGCDKTGPHLFETSPSGDYWEYHAQAIGARSQSARTYLERHFESFGDCSLEELIDHALRALSGCTEPEQELTVENASLAAVGKDLEFTVYDGDAVAPHLARLRESRAADAGAGGGAAEGKMQDDDA